MEGKFMILFDVERSSSVVKIAIQSGFIIIVYCLMIAILLSVLPIIFVGIFWLIVFIYFFIEVTLDYKALLLLLNKKDDEDYVLGGRGFDTEFCAFCDAIRVLNSYQYCLLSISYAFYNSWEWHNSLNLYI